MNAFNRLKFALAGLALGENLAWSTPFLRSQLQPEWPGRLRREMEADMRVGATTSLPQPFTLNRNPAELQPSGHESLEWAVWTLQQLIAHNGTLDHAELHSAWRHLAETPGIRGRISVQAALKNIRDGHSAPRSGQFNPHYFDDAALPRALVIGLFNQGQPDSAAEQATLDASFTQAEDGLWSASATAVLASLLGTQTSIAEVISTTVAQLPADSWSRRTVEFALEKTRDRNPLSAIDFLNREIALPVYSYGTVAHEILTVLLVILRIAEKGVEQALGLAALIPRLAQGLMPLTAAFSAMGSASDELLEFLPATLRGESLPVLVDLNMVDLLNEVKPLLVKRVAT